MKSAIIFMLLLSANILSAQQNNFKKLDLTQDAVNQSSYTFNKDFNTIQKTSLTAEKEKSVWLGAGLSALLPGAGELYAKSYVKAAIFFAAEVGLWTVWAIQRKNGDDKTDEYESYANQNWDVRKYAQWLKDESFPGADQINVGADLETLRQQLNAVESINFSHTLPAYGSQQYYEVIGKYQSFVAGWSFSSGVTRNNYLDYKPSQIKDYMTTRQDANDFYDNASTAINIVIVNHLLSAADAAWSVSMFNKNIKVETGFHYENRFSHVTFKRQMVPFADLKITF